MMRRPYFWLIALCLPGVGRVAGQDLRAMLLQPNIEEVLHVERPAGMELTFGNHPSPPQAAKFKALSATSMESAVDWAGVEPEEEQWDWSQCDKEAAALEGAGLKWTPFLIAGPAYATPLWFQNGPGSHFYRSLEYGDESRVQSIFNPEMRPRVERFLNAFAERYGNTGVLESVLLGISGIYGESIYPAGGPGGWTTRLTGEYPKRRGWWAGDAYAAGAFQQAMRRIYPNIGALNAAWKTRYGSFDEVIPFLPQTAPSDRARADFVEWYQQAMTDWAAFWAGAARKAFPNTEIYLCTGGNGDPVVGADFTAQAAAVAPWGVGIRITNEGSDYLHNFTVTREVATATRFYGTFCGFEPAGQVNAAGVVARIYNATASGARQLFFYDVNVLGSMPNLVSFRANVRWLAPRRPEPDVAFYLSRESWALDPGEIDGCYADSARLRGLVDHDYVTRRTVVDGILKNYRALVLADSPVLEPAAAAVIERWVEAGGILIGVTSGGAPIGGRLYDDGGWRRRMFPGGLNHGGNRADVARINNGCTVLIDATDGPAGMMQALDGILHESPPGFPGGEPLVPASSGPAGAYVTKTRAGELWFSPGDAKIGGVD